LKPIIDNTVGHGIVAEEMRLLARVTSALSEIGSQVAGAPDFNDALLNLRDQIAEAKPEDIGPLVEQMMRISSIAQRYGKGRDLPVNPQSPYFAHMRLQEDDSSRDVLIGKRGFIDRQRRVQIVDWRNAPVSRIYYRYEEGDDYEEPIGDRTLEGVIQVRRSLTIDDGQLRRIASPQGTYVADEQGHWYEAATGAPAELRGGQRKATRVAMRPGDRRSRLGAYAGTLRPEKHLPEIAALIDPAQFDLIVQPHSGLIVLQGGAGSGKTTVALHRVAYLNYSQPGRFRPDRMLVIVLTEAMVRYVARVLPSLGVQGVPVLTAQSWMRRTRKKILPTSFDCYNDDTPAIVLRFKKHPMLLALLAEHVDRQLARLEQELREALAEAPDGEAVLARWDALAARPPVKRCAALRGWLRQPDRPVSALALQRAQTVARRMHRRLKDVMADWAELLTDRPLLAEATARLCPGEFTGRQLDEICSWCGRQCDEVPKAAPARSRASRGVEEDPTSYISLDGQDEREVPVAGRLDRPDDAILLRLAQLKHGTLQPPGGKPVQYAHVVVDEAQDLSAIEIKVLLETAGKARSVTLAGDVAQRLAFDNAFVDWESLLEKIGTPATVNSTLKLGYRSTEQIMALARHMVRSPGAAQEWRPQRGGAAVELFRFGDRGEAVALLADALRSLALREPLASVACIARFPEQARAYAAALRRAEVPGVRLVADHEFSFKPGTEVTDVTQVKGLEFDYTILLDATAANYPDTQESRHMLYIGATRAAHQLWLLSPGPPTSLLPAEL
jgi:DNA helicase-2/ATP-dependent DNA helicase PcrA